jgi:glycosyltransferase involved in cell wall biosynthesis
MAENKNISVAIIAASVGKTPKDIPYAFVFEEAYRLAQRINVHIIRSKFEGDDYSYGINFHGIKKKIDFRALDYTMRNLSVYPSISLLRNPILIYWENLYAINVSKVVEYNDIDIIHAHFAYPEGLIGLLAKRKTKKPLIITCHGYDINIVPDIGYGIRLRKSYDTLVRLALKNADAIICVSNDMRDKVLRLGVNKEKVFVVFNGVDINLFRPPTKNEVDTLNKVRNFFGIYEDDFVILNARHLRPVYGIEYIIYAAKIVTEKVKKVKFIIAGEGELKEKLAAMIRNMNLERNVRLIGTVPKSLIRQYFIS